MCAICGGDADSHETPVVNPLARGQRLEDDSADQISFESRMMTTSLLCPDAFLSPLEIDAAVTRALAEDLGRAGDVTSIATIPEDKQARAVVVARAAGVISGCRWSPLAFKSLRPRSRSRRTPAMGPTSLARSH